MTISSILRDIAEDKMIYLFLFLSIFAQDIEKDSNITKNVEEISKNSTGMLKNDTENTIESEPKMGLTEKVKNIKNKIDEENEKDPGLFKSGIERKNLNAADHAKNNEKWKKYGEENYEKYRNWTAEMNERLKKWEQDAQEIIAEDEGGEFQMVKLE